VFETESKDHSPRFIQDFVIGSQEHPPSRKEKERTNHKEFAPASYGQIAKTFDVVLKVTVYYSHLPNCEKSRVISGWLNAAVDTKMMAMLKRCYPKALQPWLSTVEQVGREDYKKFPHKVVRRFIAEKHCGKILLVQFDDIYWKILNR